MPETPTNSRRYWEAIAQRGTWAGYYDATPDAATYNFFARRESVQRLLSGDGVYRRILDIGCGTADYGLLASLHQSTYFGVDYSLSMISQATRRTATEPGEHRFAVGAGDRLSFRDDSFDLVLALGYIEYFEDPSRTLRELRRVLAPGAVLVMQSFKWDLLGRARRRWDGLFGHTGAQTHASLPDDWVDKKYSGRELDRLLARFDFVRTDYTFNNFYLLPEVVRRHWPRLYMSLSDAAGRLAPRLLGFTAVNYVGKYTLRKAAQ